MHATTAPHSASLLRPSVRPLPCALSSFSTRHCRILPKSHAHQPSTTQHSSRQTRVYGAAVGRATGEGERRGPEEGAGFDLPPVRPCVPSVRSGRRRYSTGAMAPSCYDAAASMLLCAEEHSSILWYEEEEEMELEAVGRRRGRSPGYGDDFGADLFPPQSEECVAGLVERERDHMPVPCYGDRLRGGGGCLCVRREAVDWIWKAYTHYRFRPLTAYLAVNYLDRFLSLSEVPDGKDWMTQLLAVACVSLAAKMEETAVPQCLDLQVGDARYVFEAKTVQRMELLVLTTLNWRMQAVTPFSYVDYFLNKLNNGGSTAPRSCWLLQSAELILRAARGTGCVGFRPSEIAAAVAAAVAGDVDDADADGVENACCAHVDKERVLRCQEAIGSMASSAAIDDAAVPPKSARRRSSPVPVPVPQSPVGVLDAAGCLSYRSEEAATATATATAAASHGASSSSSSTSPVRVTSKRRKLASRCDGSCSDRSKRAPAQWTKE